MSPMTGGSMPKPTDDARAAFVALVPDDPAVATRPMFGNIAAFVNGNMFAGLFGEALFVRLPDEEQGPILERGGAAFEPMAGRPMKGYVIVPPTWRQEPDAASGWIVRSLEWARQLPAKESGRKPTARAKSRRP